MPPWNIKYCTFTCKHSAVYCNICISAAIVVGTWLPCVQIPDHMTGLFKCVRQIWVNLILTVIAAFTAVKPLGKGVSILTNKILAFPPGYMQSEVMFNLWSCDLLHTATQIGGEGVFHLLLFSCHPFGIHFHIPTIDEHLYSSIPVLLKHAITAAAEWERPTFFSSSLQMLIDMFSCQLKASLWHWLRSLLSKDAFFFQTEHHLKVLHNNANDFNVILELHLLPLSIVCFMNIMSSGSCTWVICASTCSLLTCNLAKWLLILFKEDRRNRGQWHYTHKRQTHYAFKTMNVNH